MSRSCSTNRLRRGRQQQLAQVGVELRQPRAEQAGVVIRPRYRPAAAWSRPPGGRDHT
jgi:hypothetical protein